MTYLDFHDLDDGSAETALRYLWCSLHEDDQGIGFDGLCIAISGRHGSTLVSLRFDLDKRVRKRTFWILLRASLLKNRLKAGELACSREVVDDVADPSERCES